MKQSRVLTCLCMAALHVLAPFVRAQTGTAEAEQRIVALRKQGGELFQKSQFAEAAKTFAAAYQQVEQTFGASSVAAAVVGMEVASALRQAAAFQEAVQWGTRAVANREKRGEQGTLDYAQAAMLLSEMHMDLGRYEDAYRILTAVCPTLEKLLPEKDLLRIMALHDLGVVEVNSGRPAAEEHLKKALALREEVIGKDSVPVAYTAANLGRLYYQRQLYDDSIRMGRRACDIMRAHLPVTQQMLPRMLMDLALAAMLKGDLALASSSIDEGEEVLKRFAEPGHSLYGGIAEFRGSLCQRQGRNDEAEAHLLHAIEIAKSENGLRSSTLQHAHSVIALFYRDTGALRKARNHFDEALKLAEEVSGPGGESVATILFSLGKLAKSEGDIDEAKKHFIRAFNIKQKLGEPCPADETAQLAEIFLREGRAKDAEHIVAPALAALEQQGMRGTVMHLTLVGILAQCRGAKIYDSAQVEAIARQIQQRESLKEPDKRALAELLNSLVWLKLAAGRSKEAAQDAQHAVEIEREALVPWHNWIRDSLKVKAFAQMDLGLAKDARASADDLMKVCDLRLQSLLSTRVGQERMTWLGREFPYDLPASLGYADLTATALLHFKGLGLELSATDYSTEEIEKSDEGRKTLGELDELRLHLLQQEDHKNADTKNISAQVEELEHKLAALGHRGSLIRERLRLSLADVMKVLPADAAVLDYFGYCHRKKNGDWEDRYGVVVLRRDEPPQLFVCDKSRKDIDFLAQFLPTAMRSPGEKPHEKDKPLDTFLTAVHEALIAPVVKSVAGVKTLYICPDEQLQFIPFAALRDPSHHFLCESFGIRYINSMRDLIPDERADGSSFASKTIAAFGGVNYRTENRNRELLRASTFQNERHAKYLKFLNSDGIAPLPGTMLELKLIDQAAKGAGWEMQAFTGDAASESSLYRLKNPRVVHLATHGVFLPSQWAIGTLKQLSLAPTDSRIANHSGAMDLDLNRSLVLLAGAQDTLGAWSQGMMPSVHRDGLLTAGEASQMALRHTQLVVLSACDSGKGESVSAAGMIGLRSALLSAGARNVISTLWTVRDDTTAFFMARFYQRFFASEKVAASLEETQREWLLAADKKMGLWQAVKQAGCFMLVSSGVQE